MRLQPAIALDDYEENTVSGFGDRERRLERRAERQQRRQQRRRERWNRKAQRRLVPARPTPASTPAATLQPAPTTMPPPRSKVVGKVVNRAVEWLENQFEDGDEEPSDDDDATEGFGDLDAWGPMVRMGRRLRLQAVAGHRAAVIELKPGLYLVADLPEAVTRTQFGLGPMLAPMMLHAARRSMEPGAEPRGPFARLFRRREEPIRYVQVQAPASEPLALPGPVDGGGFLVAAPNVGWADDAAVAAAFGCGACERVPR